MDTEKDIRQFLTLQRKSDQDLRAILEAMSLSTEGTRDDLIQRLLAIQVTPQLDINAPQLIPLRTRDQNTDIPGAHEFMQKARAAILQNNSKAKVFTILNTNGEFYRQSLKYIRLSYETFSQMMKNGFLYPYPGQRELLKALKLQPQVFDLHLVNKQTRDKTFVMVHCERKTG